MKTTILYLIILLMNFFPGYSQEIINIPGMQINETIHQISTVGINDILSFQTLNQGIGNCVLTLQAGNQNKATVNQQKELSAEAGNQSFTSQTGNSHELTIEQIGSGNLMLGVQLGSHAMLTGSQKDSPMGVENGNAFTSVSPIHKNGYVVEEGNKMNISQNGNNNGIMAVQQGSDNILSAEQTGNNNYLLALQQGSHNSVTDYKQANESKQILLDKIVQVGDYLSLKADGASTYKPMGNTFMQTGSNLSLEVNSSLLNTTRGVEINQTGRDMKIVVDQSYFSFPLR